ncbi:MAG: rhomboid family intramembrane serine protease, partial [Oligoflexales bacterium]|nr:rhomboid family intramembrane serine protease [Oligoflexales bacterium]
MRNIGNIKQENNAEKFVNFLTKNAIEGEIRKTQNNEFAIFIYDDSQVDAALEHYYNFLKNPDDKLYTTNTPKLFNSQKPKIDPWSLSKPRRRPRVARTSWTWVCIWISFFFLLVSWSGDLAKSLLPWFYISIYLPPFYFVEILDGQLWRLITPIFLHGDIIHFAFNMWWLYSLGKQVETVESNNWHIGLSILLALSANLGQYLLFGPNFVGMSGVIYGMLAYIFIMSRYDSGSGYDLEQSTMVIMMLWLVACLIGIFPNAANGSHVFGLIA